MQMSTINLKAKYAQSQGTNKQRLRVTGGGKKFGKENCKGKVNNERNSRSGVLAIKVKTAGADPETDEQVAPFFEEQVV